MKKEKPLVNKKYLLEKFPGKGGWTYVQINEIKVVKRKYFGGVKVRGFIDDYEIKDHNLFPMGKGILMMAVKAEIRKKIAKQEGDWVSIKLFYDEPEDKTNEEFYICLREDDAAEKSFKKATKAQQKEIMDWIYTSKNEEMKVERIAKMLDMLAQGRFSI